MYAYALDVQQASDVWIFFSLYRIDAKVKWSFVFVGTHYVSAK